MVRKEANLNVDDQHRARPTEYTAEMQDLSMAQ